MDLDDFDFDLPPELIAQVPAAARDGARLLALDRGSGTIAHATVASLADHLQAGDLLVFNDTRVFPARLLGHRVPSGGVVECFLLRRLGDDTWDALVHPGQKLKPGTWFRCDGDGGSLLAEIVGRDSFGRRQVRLTVERGPSIDDVIERIGHVPLPPYIKRDDAAQDRERYQTIFARVRGSVAAPTAGLHFTPALLERLADRRIARTQITLHVGYGTFKPMRSDRIEDHVVDPEEYEISGEAADAITRARSEGRRVIAVGTTTTRALEAVAHAHDGRVVPGRREATLFIHPGHAFRVVQGLFTNFHLPRSSLLLLVCAFAGRERVLAAYRDAIAREYRFYSYGDAMVIT